MSLAFKSAQHTHRNRLLAYACVGSAEEPPLENKSSSPSSTRRISACDDETLQSSGRSRNNMSVGCDCRDRLAVQRITM